MKNGHSRVIAATVEPISFAHGTSLFARGRCGQARGAGSEPVRPKLGGFKRLDAFTRAIESSRGPEADVAGNWHLTFDLCHLPSR
jgi:hypothetical protein